MLLFLIPIISYYNFYLYEKERVEILKVFKVSPSDEYEKTKS